MVVLVTMKVEPKSMHSHEIDSNDDEYHISRDRSFHSVQVQLRGVSPSTGEMMSG